MRAHVQPGHDSSRKDPLQFSTTLLFGNKNREFTREFTYRYISHVRMYI